MKFPEHIRIERVGPAFSMTIDGEEFAWEVAAVDTSMSPDDLPQVQITLRPQCVEVIDAIRERS